MSSRICHGCISYLNSWQSFKNRCNIAQRRHRSLLEQQLQMRPSASTPNASGKAGNNNASSGPSSSAGSGVMNQQQILNHAAQQRRQDAIQNQRMRQQRILKEALISGGGAANAAQSPQKRPTFQNNSAIDVVSCDGGGFWNYHWNNRNDWICFEQSFIKDEPIDHDDVSAEAAVGAVAVSAAADGDDDDDIVDPMQFLANDISYAEQLDDDDMMDGGENGQPPILTSLGLTQINHVSCRNNSDVEQVRNFNGSLHPLEFCRTPTMTAKPPPTMRTATSPASCCHPTPSSMPPTYRKRNAPCAT